MIIPALLCGSICLIILLLQAERRSYRITGKTEGELMAELQTIAMDGVALAALEFPMVCDVCNGLDPWNLVGGWRGIRRMENNSRLLLALATQAQSWARPSSGKALQDMRRELQTIRRTVLLSQCDRMLHWTPKANTLHARTAACAYYQMTESLLSLYRHSPSRLYAHLEAALWPDHPSTLEGASA